MLRVAAVFAREKETIFFFSKDRPRKQAACSSGVA